MISPLWMMAMQPLKPPEPMDPNAIQAAYMQMFNRGEHYLPQLNGPPLHIDDWKARELARWEEAEREKREGERQ